MTDPSAHRPAVDFFQGPAVVSKATENLLLGLLCELERKKVLRAEDVFDSLAPLTTGQNSAHEIGLTLGFWRRTARWLLGQDKARPSNRAA
jgi:hypothetical protein